MLSMQALEANAYIRCLKPSDKESAKRKMLSK